MTQLQMKLPILDGDAAIAIPRLRRAGLLDAQALSRLLDQAFPEQEWSPERARRELLEEPTVAEVLVIEDGDELLATASARYHEGFPGAGYVHWVGVAPGARGRQLGQIVTLGILARFARDGKSQAVLETDDERLAAIASYLAMGFVPQYPGPDHESRWSKVFASLAAFRRRNKQGT